MLVALNTETSILCAWNARVRTSIYIYIYIYSHTNLSKELSSEAINWILPSAAFTKVDFFIVIYSLFENHLQKHFVKGTLLDDHLQNA